MLKQYEREKRVSHPDFWRRTFLSERTARPKAPEWKRPGALKEQQRKPARLARQSPINLFIHSFVQQTFKTHLLARQ
jgi:hypothetical protein